MSNLSRLPNNAASELQPRTLNATCEFAHVASKPQTPTLIQLSLHIFLPLPSLGHSLES
jgi:hypothetical protein